MRTHKHPNACDYGDLMGRTLLCSPSPRPRASRWQRRLREVRRGTLSEAVSVLEDRGSLRIDGRTIGGARLGDSFGGLIGARFTA